MDLEPRSAKLPKIRGGKGGEEKEKEFRTLGARGVLQLPQGNAMMGTATAAARGSSPQRHGRHIVTMLVDANVR